jgi:alkanesulfonate monooxygenase SsuD/methylene tetrahydromethanopterin reductase-like flavin-dependent oxidoreductase (luciferase family)
MSTPALAPKPLHFNAFVMNTVSHIHHGQWRRPDAGQTEFTDVNTWIDLAKLLEEAKFDGMFFADVSGLYGDADADYDVYVREGLQIPSNDPTVLLSALAVSTEHIGLATTSNVFQSHPFHFARQISTLDHISNGRIAWNIVTGTQDNGARNFGLPQLTDHAERYEWAEEYVDVTYKLWEGSWDEGAVLKDRSGDHADPTKIHKIHHRGKRYSVEGRTCPRRRRSARRCSTRRDPRNPVAASPPATPRPRSSLRLAPRWPPFRSPRHAHSRWSSGATPTTSSSSRASAS